MINQETKLCCIYYVYQFLFGNTCTGYSISRFGRISINDILYIVFKIDECVVEFRARLINYPSRPPEDANLKLELCNYGENVVLPMHFCDA